MRRLIIYFSNFYRWWWCNAAQLSSTITSKWNDYTTEPRHGTNEEIFFSSYSIWVRLSSSVARVGQLSQSQSLSSPVFVMAFLWLHTEISELVYDPAPSHFKGSNDCVLSSLDRKVSRIQSTHMHLTLQISNHQFPRGIFLESQPKVQRHHFWAIDCLRCTCKSFSADCCAWLVRSFGPYPLI